MGHPFMEIDVPSMLGVKTVCGVTDLEVWDELFSPDVRRILGNLTDRGTVEVRETVKGKFPGDDVTNLNGHRIYGRDGYVRNRYLVSTYRTTNGAFIVKRDGMKFKALGFVGNLDASPELVIRASLRDRDNDGTPIANDCSLLDYPFDDPESNKPILFHGRRERSVELSIYGFTPGTRVVADVGTQAEYEAFIANPFEFVAEPARFLDYFRSAWEQGHAPGQVSQPIGDLSKHVLPAFETIAARKGYERIDAAPSHYHVLRWLRGYGYCYAEQEQSDTVQQLEDGLDRIRRRGLPLSRAQQSWICIIQSLEPAAIPPELYIGGAQWPQDNISPRNLWCYKRLAGEPSC